MQYRAAALLLAAFAVLAPPEDYGPFGEDEDVKPFPLNRCFGLDRDRSERREGVAQGFMKDPDDASCVRLVVTRARARPPEGGCLAEVASSDGTLLCGPVRISDRPHPYRVSWADLNGDGAEDFVVEVSDPRKGPEGYLREVAFVLSSPSTPGEPPPEGSGYRITTVRTLASRTVRFLDLGDGRCRFLHTAFVFGGSEKGRDGRPHNYWVHNLLEFEGDRVVVSKGDGRFPMWVWYTFRPNHEETTMIAAEQKKRLWAKVPERIFLSPAEPRDRASPAGGDPPAGGEPPPGKSLPIPKGGTRSGRAADSEEGEETTCESSSSQPQD